ncbi:SDR family oxidoreductase [Lusitaniella coriacea]|uniref:SDR family oxidoreductase n=1 Tax=Lusitaniella coriacea TaxID=1983105 RepID=UPI003CF4F4AB
MKVAVIGASGLVGSHLIEAARDRGWDTIGTYHQFPQPELLPLDIRNSQEVSDLLSNFQPNAIFLPAFCSNVDRCEKYPEETAQINVEGSLNVARVAKPLGAKLVFYSSDYVFNGTAGPYAETDSPNPICVYGKQKLAVEQQIQTFLETALILRITVVYGNEAQGKNFVNRLIKTLQNGETIRVPCDQIGSPTLVNDIAEASLRLVEANASGIFHVVGSDVMSRYDFALEIARMFDLPADKIIPITTPELKQAAPRPLLAGMTRDRVISTLSWQLRGVKEGLEYLKQERSKVSNMV